jgi:hypothetical protein
MSHMFQLSDEQYAKLAAYAAQHRQTPEMLFQSWLREVTHDVQEPASTSTNYSDQVKREEELLNSPLFEVAGIFAIGEPGWADKHDEYLAEGYMENHADCE